MATKGAPKTITKQYRFLGDHATELELQSGARFQVGPGDFVDLTDADAAGIHPEQMAYLLDVSSLQPTSEELEVHAAEAEAATAEGTTATEEVTTSDK